jgi:hypothetical protein
VNKYEITFVVCCPVNNKQIAYYLQIETINTIMVEDLISFCNAQSSKFHEELADELSIKFGGNQKMTAFHHGVQITTERK